MNTLTVNPPLPPAECMTGAGSYAPAFYILAAVVGALGAAAWFARVPSPAREEKTM
jgi:hypothetical protein